ncbi:MAG: sigma 54-interacting transcriptional regulator [Deltaproteobacteria bacterium]|nr:sigma 54-interacting transcriptional regulator [Deltaproteobacteria bacterium]
MSQASGMQGSPHARELSALVREHALARADGQGRTAFVRGPSGVGKRELLASLQRELSAQGVRVLAATGGAGGAYALFRPLVKELLALLAESGVPARTVDELGKRCGPLRGEQAQARADDAPLELADAVAELFALAGRSAPCYLLGELEAADRASLELLRYLLAAAQAPGARAGGLYVLAFRDEGALPEPLADIAAKVTGVTVSLTGLDLDGIRSYLTRPDVAERLLDLTGGLPAVLEQVLAAPPEANPERLFLRRLDRLAEPERDALAALALADGPSDAELLASVVARARGTAALDLSTRLERLAGQRILTVDGGRYRFARQADREALCEWLTESGTAELHRAWGEALRAQKSEPERVARHLLLADPTGSGVAAALDAAHDLAARLASDDAIALYHRAQPFAPREKRLEIDRALAELYRQVADYPSALRHLARWRRALPEAERALPRAQAARILVTMGRLGTAEKLLTAVLGANQRLDASDAAKGRAFADLGEVLFLRGDYTRAAKLSAEALPQLAEHFDLAFALRNTLGKVHLAQGEYPLAAACFAENAQLALGRGATREAAQATLNRGVVAHRQGDKRAAIALYREALPELDKKGQAHALSNLGSLYAESGEFDPAVDHLSRALTAFSRARRAKEVAHCAGNLARLELFLGDLDRAGELREHMSQSAAAVGDPYLCASAELIGAEVLEARGEAREAFAAYRSARAAFEKLSSPRYAAEAALGGARAALAAGERADARMELLAPSIDALAPKTPAIAVERDLVAGELALLAGELPEATRRLSRAKEQLLAEPDLEGPYRVYALLAKLRQACGDPSGAAAELARAARLLEELSSRVSPLRRQAFAQLPRRASVLAAAAEREITPARVHRALDLGAPSVEEVSVAMVGRCEPVQKVFRMLPPVARANTTVLIRGESGTGKELIAEAIHRGSPRREMPLVKVNCAAMVEDLLLSELFGHDKGAFTGAVRERKGRFELADGGTIFLDEVGDLSPKAQVALLRVLQERTFERVGGTKTLSVDVRVVCATNRDLEGMIASGQFRQDLYYRLKGVMLELPALRERGEDLSLLCSHFLARIARTRNEEAKVLAPEALELLARHTWPGNIRELENVLESASLFASGRVIGVECFDHLPELRGEPRGPVARPLPAPPAAPTLVPEPAPLPAPAAELAEGPIDYFEIVRRRGVSLKDLRQEMETQCIARALGEGRGNISEAARILRMKRSRLSQIVNADPQLRSLSKGGPGDADGVDSDLED